jgi:hypothetical protein
MSEDQARNHEGRQDNKPLNWILRTLKYAGLWIITALVTTLLAVSLQTQNVISRLGDIGADIGFLERLSMTFYDILHLGSVYGIFIALAFLIAFLAAALLHHFTQFGRSIIFGVAGGMAILVMLFSIKQVFFDIHIIAGARDSVGISLQVIAGIFGGLFFARVTRKRYKDA